MSLLDPFSLATPMFTEKFKKTMSLKFDKFLNDFYTDYLSNTYVSEYFATIAYKLFQERFQNGFYSQYTQKLTDKELHDIDTYFSKLIADENKHLTMLENLLARYQISIPTQALEQTLVYANEELDVEDLFKSLSLFYIGECNLWTGFYTIYTQTQDSEVKKIFYEFLLDETRHNHYIRKIFKILKKKIIFDFEYYNKIVAKKKYFGLDSIRINLGLQGIGSKQDLWWENIIFDSKIHQDFFERFVAKCYKLILVFDPSIEFENYKQTIYCTHYFGQYLK